MHPEISVIIPFYNVEKYIDECLASIEAQTFGDFEAILINDASTDMSSTVANKYLQKDKRFKLITLENNKGPGAARNIGMKEVLGKYTCFIDSDDYIVPETFEILINRVKKSDILIFNGNSFNEEKEYDTNKYFPLEENYFYNNRILNDYKMQLVHCQSPCLKIYSTSFLKNNHLFFPEGVYGEDVEFWMRCLLATKKICYTDFHGYMRRYREGSIMTSLTEKNLRDRIAGFDVLLELCEHDLYINNYIIGVYIPWVVRKVHTNKNEELIDYLNNTIYRLAK